MCTAIPIISTVNDLIDAGVISLFWRSKARGGALNRKEFIFIFVTSSTQTNKLLANISRELVKSGIGILSINYPYHSFNPQSMCTAQTLFSLFNSKKQKKNYWVIIIIIITEEYLCYLPSAVFIALLLVGPSLSPGQILPGWWLS